MIGRKFIFLFLFLPYVTNAQVTMEDFLQAAWEEPSLKSFANQNQFLSSKPYRLAPVQRLEFRTESNQLDPARQDYALRINPANPWEMKRNNQYFRTYQETLQLDRDRLLKQSLQARYQVIINWLYYQELSELKANDKQNSERLLLILEGQRYSDFFDVEDYIKLKLEQVDKTIELEETHFEIDNQQRKVEALHEQARGKTLLWPTDAVVSIKRLEAIVDSLTQLAIIGGEVQYREKKIDLTTHEWQLEKSNINVGFLQAQYQPYRVEQGRKPWNLSLGVTIPVFNPNKGDMTKRKLEVIEAEGDLDVAKGEQQAGRELMHAKIKSLIQRYNEVDNMTENLNVSSMASILQQFNSSNPSATIQFQSKLIKLKTISARLRQEILLSYIEYLGYSEVIQHRPLVNFLSPVLTPIEP
jgi:hypothetical protein